MSGAVQKANVFGGQLDVDERGELRANIHALTRRTEEAKNDEDKLNMATFSELMDKTEELHGSVELPPEALADAKQMAVMGEMGVRTWRKLNKIKNFTLDEVVQELNKRFTVDASGDGSDDGEYSDAGGKKKKKKAGRPSRASKASANARLGGNADIDWIRLGKLAGGYCQSLHTNGFLNGTIGADVPETAKRQANARRAKLQVEEEEQPEDVQDASTEAKSQTDLRIEAVKNIVGNVPKKGIPYWDFVLNPDSFTETIENIFDCSFVVKDGQASLEPDKMGEVILAAHEAPNAEEYMAHQLQDEHFILRFNKADYDALVKANYEGPIPSRAHQPEYKFLREEKEEEEE
jgi:hypothetical protein